MLRYSLIAIILGISPFTYSQWEYVGDPLGVTQYEIIHGELKFQPVTGIAYFMYQNFEINVAAEISMQRFDGSWEYVGDQVIAPLIVNNEHLDFDFNPLAANVPIAYYADGQNSPQVVTLNGTVWENYPGLSNYLINTDLGFGFDVGSTGNPVLGFNDPLCQNGQFPGNMSVLVHNSEEWLYLGNSCLTPNDVGSPDLEYSPITNELFAYNKGGNEISTFDYHRILWKLNGSQWDSITSPPFTINPVIGNMEVNPVTGNVFMYDWDYTNGIGSERLFKVFEWDGSTIDSLPAFGQVNIGHDNWKVAFHPITGEIHVVFIDTDLTDTQTGTHLNVKKYDGSNWVETPFSDIQNHPSQSNAFVDVEFSPTGELYIVRIENFDGKAVVLKHSGISDGIDEISSATAIKIYPSPATDQISFDQKFSPNSRIKIYQGARLVEDRTLNSNTLQVNHLPSGMYQIQIESGGSYHHGRFIKN